jgi:hypothetical protein
VNIYNYNSLKPFCLKTSFSSDSSSCRLSSSQMALALCTRVESTDCLLDGWWWDVLTADDFGFLDRSRYCPFK